MPTISVIFVNKPETRLAKNEKKIIETKTMKWKTIKIKYNCEGSIVFLKHACWCSPDALMQIIGLSHVTAGGSFNIHFFVVNHVFLFAKKHEDCKTK